MLLYNLGQVLLCGWMVYEAIRQHRLQGLKFICNQWPSYDARRDGMAFVTYVFYISKIFDFFDTIFHFGPPKVSAIFVSSRLPPYNDLYGILAERKFQL